MIHFRIVAILTIGVSLGLALVPSSVHSQVNAGFELTAGAGYESYRFSSASAANLESISLLALPFSAATPLIGPTTLQVRGAFAHGTLVDAAGTETTLSGLVDTEVALGVTFGTATTSATLTAIGLAPTGTSQHDGDEARVAGLIASEFLPFRITNWGTGGAFGVSANVARVVGQGSIGIGVGYLAAREFDPFEPGVGGETFAYRPGDQMQLRLAADQDLGTSAKLSLAFVFERHQEDRLDGANLYQAGNRYQGMGSYAFAAGARSTAIVYAGGLHTEEGVGFDVPLSHDFSSRTLLLFGGGTRMPLGGVVLSPSLDGRVYRRGSGLGQGYMGGVGATLEVPAGSLALVPGARLRLGNFVVDDDVESGITGFDLGLEIRFGR
jgi:hypothetical protein